MLINGTHFFGPPNAIFLGGGVIFADQEEISVKIGLKLARLGRFNQC